MISDLPFISKLYYHFSLNRMEHLLIKEFKIINTASDV